MAGRFQKKVQWIFFWPKYFQLIEKKPWSIYVLMDTKKWKDQEFKRFISHSLIEHASAKGFFGGEFIIKRWI